MKTLDEVIGIMDGIDQTCTCCAYQHDCDETECIEKDALHYLKEYKEKQIDLIANHEELTALRDYYAETQHEPNDPLDWEELQEKEKKPVWVECKDRTGWAIYDGIFVRYGEICGIFVFGLYSTSICPREEIGKTWNAYRKERDVSAHD